MEIYARFLSGKNIEGIRDFADFFEPLQLNVKEFLLRLRMSKVWEIDT